MQKLLKKFSGLATSS